MTLPRPFPALACALAVLAAALPLDAQVATPASPSPADTAKRWPDRDRNKPLPLTLSPAPESKPSLRLALLPRREETDKGNAAVKYLAAVAERPRKENGPEGDRLAKLLDDAIANAPLADLDPADADIRKLAATYTVPPYLAQGARLDSVDWETNIRRQGFETLIPTLGGMRDLTKALRLQIRLDIRAHNWPAAREKICTGLALANHLGKGETLIESLVGIAIATSVLNTLEDWIAEPGAPNLYWPLSNLPAPFNDLHRAMEFERSGIFFSVPEIKDIRAGRFSGDEWERLVRSMTRVSNLTGQTPGTHPDWQTKATAAAMAAALYSPGKDFLVARGTPRDAVEKLSVNEVVCRYFVDSYEEETDDLFKWSGLPTSDAYQGMRNWEKSFQERRAKNQVNLMAAILLPSLTRTRVVSAKLDRQIAALRILENIRAYAADKHALPANLADLPFPVPVDPTTAAPFRYTLSGNTATLFSPGMPETKPETLQYDITLRP